MTFKNYFSYVRVSTARQGQLGTSLAEQHSSIERYANRKNLKIIKEFHEQETAARRGRPIFQNMIDALKAGKACSVIIHKIDRGARNLKDWAELGELIDAGVEIHFANENLDLYSRGGRLSADIQAVVAADYIRNLREEVKKGLYGRIKQGFYPMPAPLGYLDQGGGKPKAVDQRTSSFIEQVFRLYATGRYSLDALTSFINQAGFRRKSGREHSRNTIANILHNIFYTGIIHIKSSDEYFLGKHEPIISKQLFDKVQTVLSGRSSKSERVSHLREAFLFRRLLTCKNCGLRLVGERQKGRNYYRCHSKNCPGTIREEKIYDFFWALLKKLAPDPCGDKNYEACLSSRRRQIEEHIKNRKQYLTRQLTETGISLERLTDAFIGEAIEKSAFLKRKNIFIAREVELKEALANLESDEHRDIKQLEKLYDFMKTACPRFRYGSYEQKREAIGIIAKRIDINKKQIIFNLHEQVDFIYSRKIS